QDYTKAIALNPNFAEAYHNRGLVYVKLSELEKGLADWKKAASLYQQQGKTDDYQKLLNEIEKLEQLIKLKSLNVNP
ncbi:MAG TPA: tetratricopeptide repeat protein, partial [Allocoleopsis sp.]